jgi:urea transport system substrate-binding protein
MPPAVPERSSDQSDAPPFEGALEADLDADLGATSLSNSDDTSASLRAGERSAEKREALLWVGQRLARYEITQVLGMGGMGVVYLAHDTLIDRDVAIKMLSRSLSSDERILKRFLIEAKAAGKLNHANTVAIYEIGQEADAHFLVMEFVSGGSVDARLETQGAYSVLEATRIAADAGKGLAAAHRAGLVHRDIKPGNLLFAADGTVKVADFGLAKNSLSQGEQVTQSGQVLGTPYFMSPEQCQASPVDHRGDIYSLGATYYTLLTGTNPYVNAGSIVQVMFAHCHGYIPDPRAINEHIPAACTSIIARAMAKCPEDRYQSAEEMLADLTAVSAAISVTTISGSGRTEPATAAAAGPAAKSATRRQALVAGGGLAAVFFAGAALTLFWKSGQSTNGRESDRLRQVTSGGEAPGIVPTGPPLRVGVLHSLSGTLASSESPVVDATLLAIEEINKAGGLLGRPVEAVISDGRSDEAVFAVEAERLIAREHVATVFGCWTSSCRKTVKPIFEEHDHLLIYPVQHEGLEESPNVFYLGAAPNQQIIPAVNWAFTVKGKRRFFLVGSDYVFPRTANAIIKDTLWDLGVQVVGEEYLALGEIDTKALVAKIAAAGPDVILNTINGDSNLSFFKELRRAGITSEKTPTISFSIGEAEMRQLDLSQITGDFAAWNYFQSLPSAENLTFVRKFQNKFGRQRVLTDPMEAAYVGVKLWAAAVAEARSDKPADIRRALQNRRWHAPEGEVRIDPSTQHAFKTPRIGKITADGQFEMVWTAAKPEPPQPYPPTRTAEEWKAFLNDLYKGWGNRWTAPE